MIRCSMRYKVVFLEPVNLFSPRSEKSEAVDWLRENMQNKYSFMTVKGHEFTSVVFHELADAMVFLLAFSDQVESNIQKFGTN